MSDHYQNEIESDYVDPEAEYWSRCPAPLQGTLLGHYLASRRTRWLTAFMCYVIGYAIACVLIISVFTNISDTKQAISVLSKSGWALTLACALFAIGGYASGRLHIAISMTIAFLLFLFFHTV